MNRRADRIGFSQRVRLEWLEHTANYVLAGNEKSALNEALQELLREKISVGGQAIRGNREKIITILLKVWVTVPRELESLRLDGLDLIRRLPRTEHVAVHWGMVMASYPFWAGVAAQVQRRVREQYGERETVSRAARRVLRSFLDWGVLSETTVKGVYSSGISQAIDDPQLLSWLIEATLRARANGSVPLKELIESPSLFPFRLNSSHAEGLVSASSKLEILRHGLDDNL